MEKQRKILIVDDNFYVLKSMARIFSNSGYEVVKASHGQEALSMLEKLAKENSLPDYMLTDNDMPIMSGISLINEMYQRGLTGVVRTALWTGGSGNDLRKRVESYGAKYFEKPSSGEELLAYFDV